MHDTATGESTKLRKNNRPKKKFHQTNEGGEEEAAMTRMSQHGTVRLRDFCHPTVAAHNRISSILKWHVGILNTHCFLGKSINARCCRGRRRAGAKSGTGGSVRSPEHNIHTIGYSAGRASHGEGAERKGVLFPVITIQSNLSSCTKRPGTHLIRHLVGRACEW